MNHFLFNLFLLILSINGLVALKTKSNRTKINKDNSADFFEIDHEEQNHYKIMSENDLLIDEIIPIFRKCRGYTCGVWGAGERSWHSEECLIESRNRFYSLFKELLSKNENSYRLFKEKKLDGKQTVILEYISDSTLNSCIRFDCPVIGTNNLYFDGNCVKGKMSELKDKFKEYVEDYEEAEYVPNPEPKKINS